jgi:hypothetical protein
LRGVPPGQGRAPKKRTDQFWTAKPLGGRVRPRRCRRIAPRCATRPSNSRAKSLARFMLSLSAREPPKRSIDGPKNEPMVGGGVGLVSGLLRARKCRRGGVRCARGHGKRPGSPLTDFSPRVLGFRVSSCPTNRTGCGNLGYFENIWILGF